MTVQTKDNKSVSVNELPDGGYGLTFSTLQNYKTPEGDASFREQHLILSEISMLAIRDIFKEIKI